MSRNGRSGRKIRYAVVGLGHLTQVAVLPAFRQAQNSELVAIVSGDAEKRTYRWCAPVMNRLAQEGWLNFQNYPRKKGRRRNRKFIARPMANRKL